MASLGWVTVSERRSTGFTLRQYMGVTDRHSLPGYTMRPPDMDENAAVAEVINGCEVEARGEREANASDITKSWTAPGFDLRTDARAVVDDSGHMVGYAEFERTDSPAQIECDGFVRPEFRGLGLGSWLLDWIEARANEIAADAPAGSRAKLQHFLWMQEKHGADLLTSRGFGVVRHFYQLVIDLDPPPAPPEWSQGIVVRKMLPGDERALYAADEEAFSDHWGFVATPFEVFRHHNFEGENFDPDLVFLAMDGADIAGGSICRLHRTEDDAGKGWVGDLFVRRPWRRRGIARALLLESFAAYRNRGYERVGLGVDAENPTGALDLYLGVGMSVDSEALCFEKELPPADR